MLPIDNFWTRFSVCGGEGTDVTLGVDRVGLVARATQNTNIAITSLT